MEGSSDYQRVVSHDGVEDAIARIARGTRHLPDEVLRLTGLIADLISLADEWGLGSLYSFWANFHDYLDAGEMLDASEATAVVALATAAAQEWGALDGPWAARDDYFARWEGFTAEHFPLLYGPGGRIQRFFPDSFRG